MTSADQNITEHEDITSTTASSHLLYSRPFNNLTDSRNDFRSAEHSKMYSNREECRDVFLAQLRSFQDLKSMIDDGVIEIYNENLRRTIYSLLSILDMRNMVWFAEFFCDMLIQIGISTAQETDDEILANRGAKDQTKIQKVSELSERVLIKETSILAMNPAKWLQT